MGYRLIIAEKSSVANELSNVLGANHRKSNYMEGNGYLVSYAVGHLLQLAGADAYNPEYKKWAIEDLPILPDTFLLTVIESTKKQYETLKQLMLREDVSEIICATDAGREGELIFRHIYEHTGCKKTCKRLWINSLTEESILSGMNAMKDIKEYDLLYASAYARAKADWLFGINFSRLFSIKNNNRLTCGRVQTPTLHLIVRRDYEIENFIKEKYYTLKMENGATWFRHNADNIKTISEAEKIKVECVCKNAIVNEIKLEKKIENRPLLYSLSSLQQEANKKLGFSAQKTLDIAQRLYEAKLTTYPRTDSNYLPDDMKRVVEDTANKLARFYKPAILNEILKDGLNLDGRIFNNNKVSDHHAIIPTKEIQQMNGSKMTLDEQALLEMIIDRFILILSVPHVYNLETFIFEVEGETFKASSRKVLQEGFKRFFLHQDSKHSAEQQVDNFVEGLKYSKGDTFKVKTLDILEGVTKSKAHFTDATLLSIMENIDRELEDTELKEFVKERGLGTPATRAGIIEKLIQVKYVERKGKYLVSTSLGRKFIAAIPPAVKDIDLTASWEQTLLSIEKGTATEMSFLEDIIQNITVVVTLESTRAGERVMMDKEVVGICPRCSKHVVEYDKSYCCEGYQDEPKCGFVLWKNDKSFTEKGKILTKNLAVKLLKGQKVIVKGLKNKDGSKTYDAYVCLQDTGKYVNYKFESGRSDNDSLVNCPRCGKQIYENEKSFYCSGYKDDTKCSFSIWKNDKFFAEKGKSITRTMAVKMMKGNKVLVKGLKSKEGNKEYDAYIILNDTGKYVNFKIAEYVKNVSKDSK